MMPVPFKLAGPTGGHRSTQFSSELTRNVYMDYAESADRVGMHDFPGLKPWGASGGSDRGQHEMAGVLYKINGANLYRVSVAGAYASVGSVPGSDRAVFADDGSNMLFTAGGVLYKCDGSAVSTVSQSVVVNPRSVAYINRQFIITGDDGLFAVSNVGDPDTWNALNYAEEETAPDGLLRAYVFSQLVYMMGSKTVVPWYNSGVGNPPFDRQETALVNIGLAGTFAVCNTDQFLYWLGDDRKVYQAVGASARPVSTSAIANKLEPLPDVSDAIMSRFVFEGQDFVLLALPAANLSLLFSETLQVWTELNAGTNDPGDRWYGNQVFSCYGKNLVSDYRNGNIYEMDRDTFTDNGDTRLRIRVLPSFTSALIGRPGRRIIVSKIRINMQCGVGLASGQGANPVLMCQLSNDGGHTWGTESHVEIGVMGDYIVPVDYDEFASGYEIRCKIKCSDPVFLSMFDGVVYLRDGGY